MMLRFAVRRALVWSFIALFIVIGSYLSIKMLGYVIDIKNVRLVKAGGVYVKYTPRTATLFLDGDKYPSSSGFLTNDIYVPGLAPGAHTLSLSLPEYNEWTKELKISSGMVAQSKDIILWPKKLAAVTTSSDVAAFWLTGNGTVTRTSAGALRLGTTPLKGNEVILSNEDSPYVVTAQNGTYYFIDLGDTSSTLTLNALFSALRRAVNPSDASKMRGVISHPFTRTTLLIPTGAGIYALDTKKQELSLEIADRTLLAFATSNNQLFAINGKGTLIAINLILHSRTNYPLHFNFARHFIADPSGSNLFLEDGAHDLYHFDLATETVKKIGANIAFFSFSPDSKRGIMIDENAKATILYLADYEENVIRKQGDTTTFTLERGEDPHSFAWMPFTQNYFLIHDGTRVLVEEFDARSARNVNTLATDASRFAIHNKTLSVLDHTGVLSTYALAR